VRPLQMKIVFLDRDGVINKKAPEKLADGTTGYTRNWSEFHWLHGSKQALKILKDKGYLIIVISNQHGVYKGLYTKEDVWEIEKNLQAELQKELGIQIDAFYNCFHGKDENCNCRKPKPGMILQGLKDIQGESFSPASNGGTDVKPRSEATKEGLTLLRKDSIFMVGDSVNDILAGQAAGAKTIFLTTRLAAELSLELEELDKTVKPDYIFPSLLGAVQKIL